jgi:hypothetical protein
VSERQDELPALPREYWETTYFVGPPGRQFRVRIGQRCSELGGALGPVPWVIVTAWNPGSVRLSNAENARRQEELEKRVSAWPSLPALGKADTSDWFEKGVLLIGMEEEEGRALARAFGQNALVIGIGGEVARLIDCRAGPGIPPAAD